MIIIIYVIAHFRSVAMPIMYIVNFVLLACLLFLAVMRIIDSFFSGFNASSLIIALFMILACAFTGIAPYGWMSQIDTLFAFMKTEIWRPCFVIILGLLSWDGGFTSFNDNIVRALADLAGYLCIVLGIFELVIDILAICLNKTCLGKSTDGK